MFHKQEKHWNNLDTEKVLKVLTKKENLLPEFSTLRWEETLCSKVAAVFITMDKYSTKNEKILLEKLVEKKKKQRLKSKFHQIIRYQFFISKMITGSYQKIKYFPRQ